MQLFLNFQNKERLIIILAKSLVFLCTLLVSNKSIFTHLVTLIRISYYNCMSMLISQQQKFESFRRGRGERFCVLERRSVKRGEDKTSKTGGGGTKRGDQDFLNKLEGEPTQEDAVTVFYKIVVLKKFAKFAGKYQCHSLF